MVKLLLLLSLKVFAAPTSVQEAPLQMSAAGIKRLVVVAYAGDLRISASTKKDIWIQTQKNITPEPGRESEVGDLLSQLLISHQVIEDRVEVRATLPGLNRERWSKWAQKDVGTPRVRMEIQVPSGVTVEVFLNRGTVGAKGLSSGLQVISQNAKVAVANIEGAVEIKTVAGQIQVSKIKGPVGVESYSAPVTVAEVTGKLKLKSFLGTSEVENVDGPIAMTFQKGKVSLQKTKGNLDFDNSAASIKVSDHDGSINGKTDTGGVNVKLSGAVDVKLESQSGNLVVQAPRDSKARVTMFSAKGSLTAPSGVDRQRGSTGATAWGRLRGTESGSIRLKSDSGDIVLK